jgi:hypothetical protein
MQSFRDDPKLSQIHEGMKVVDVAGDEVGKVDLVQMGDPQATTVDTETRPQTVLDSVVQAVALDESEPDVPEPLRSRLRISGYLKIDGPDLMDTDRYVSSQNIREVREDRVMLSVRKDDLPREA